MKYSGFIYGCVLFVMHAAAAQRPDSSHFWPLECNPAVTSMFCDYRPGHFHSGTDLKTWGRTGIPVISEGASCAFKASVSTGGYGRALYVQLDNGEYRVYGHLERYTSAIEAMVRERQYATRKYTTVIMFKKDQIRFKKGEVIALSGESGVGFPHLHYEHRSRTNVPRNPLAHGLYVKDTRAPILQEIAVKPLRPGSTVNGCDSVYVAALKGGTKNQYAVERPIQAYGCIGFALNGYDCADAAGNKFGLYRTRLFLDDSLLFSAMYDSFNFETTRQVHLDRDLFLIRSGMGDFYNLYREEGTILPFYGDFPANAGLLGVQDLPADGLHRVRILADDVSGNSAEATIALYYIKPPVIARIDLLPHGKSAHFVAHIEPGGFPVRKTDFFISPDGNQWKKILSREVLAQHYYSCEADSTPLGFFYVKALASDSLGFESTPLVTGYASSIPRKAVSLPSPELFLSAQGDLLTVTLISGAPLPREPDISVSINDTAIQLPIPRSSRPGEYTVKFRAAFSGQKNLGVVATVLDFNGSARVFGKQFQVGGSSRESGIVVTSPDNIASAYVRKGAVFNQTFIWLQLYPDSLVRTWPELVQASLSYAFEPGVVYYDQKLSIGIKAPRKPKTGLFTSKGGEGWRFNSSEYDTKSGNYTGAIWEHIPFCLFTDEIPPAVSFRPGQGKPDTVPGQGLLISVDDRGAGINAESINAFIDSQWTLCEYDPEKKSVSVFMDSVTAGNHLLSFSVRDNLDNETVVSVPFVRP